MMQILHRDKSGSGIVIALRGLDDGSRDLIVYRPDDGPSARNLLHLTEEEAVALATAILKP